MNKVPVINMTATGRKIRDLRVAAGISVRELQAALGFANPQSIYKWQRGDGMPSIDNLVVIAAVFGVKVDDILIVQ
jgi:transcriptional regulator with XRE-family HTH domain